MMFESDIKEEPLPMNSEDSGAIEIRFERIPYEAAQEEAQPSTENAKRARDYAQRLAMPRLARLDAQVLLRLTRRRAQFGIIH
jgi:hypothetical protein